MSTIMHNHLRDTGRKQTAAVPAAFTVTFKAAVTFPNYFQLGI